MNNPYAPPSAAVADIDSVTTSKDPTPFFAVSLVKLLILSVCTLGLYEVYWFYQNWQLVKRRERSNISPAPRALFAAFYCYSLFVKIRDYDAPSSVRLSISAGPLAAGWIIASLCWRAPHPYEWISMGATLFMLPVQARANEINAAVSPQHDRNSSFSLWNWVAVFVGGAIVLLALAGTVIERAGA